MPSATTRNHALDGIRALAVATVISYHGQTYTLASGGHAAVAVFCVLSGWLITTGLLATHTRTGTWKTVTFYTTRAARLLPALAILVVAVTGASLAFGGTGHIADIDTTITALTNAATFTTNLTLSNGNHLAFELVPTWSLALENQYYLLLPAAAIAAAAATRKHPARTLAAVTGAAAVCAYTYTWLAAEGSTHEWMTFSPATTCAPLLAGTAAGAYWHHHRTHITEALRARRAWTHTALAAAITVICYALYNPPGHPLPTSTWAGPLLAAATITLIAGTSIAVTSPVTRALAARPLRWIGERSYGLYLYHVPILIWVTTAAGASIAEGPGVVKVAAVILAVAAAAASYRWIETPIYSWHRRRTNLHTTPPPATIALQTHTSTPVPTNAP